MRRTLLPSPPRLTSQLVALEQAANHAVAGRMTLEAFRDLVDRVAERIRSQLERVRALEIPPDLRAEIRDELHAGDKGAKLYLEALRDLVTYTTTRDLVHLQVGIEKARTANELLNQAVRLNWETQDTYLQSLEDFAGHMGGNIASPPPPGL